MTPTTPRKLWEHPDPTSTNMYRFMQTANKQYNLNMQTYQDLYAWSVDDDSRTDFWDLAFKQLNPIHQGTYSRVVDVGARMDSVPKWFEGVQLNFAENVLFSSTDTLGERTTVNKEDAKLVATEVREGGTEVRHFTWKELRRKMGLLANAMRARGVRKGDRVAVVASNSLDTMSVFLAVTSLGGLFSSSSTDMGTKGVLDRLRQIGPKWVFIDDQAVYNGKTVDLKPKIEELVRGMADISEFRGVVAMPRFQSSGDVWSSPKTTSLASYLEAGKGDSSLTFERVDFSDPFLIVYSSGTTGVPKCIVHSVGGILISAMKEARLHRDTGPTSVICQYTTTGWIMYLSAVLGLIHGARTILYDGSPFLPDLTSFIKIVADHKVTNLGISPRYLHELQKNNVHPRDIADLSALKAVTSTGMVLKDSLFEWFYDLGFPRTTQLSNISGGTDIAGCFGMENPLMPLYVGGCQGASLGTPVEVYDQTLEGGKGVKGVKVDDGTPGELIATKSFPNMPIFFWGSDGSQKYFNSYFARFDDVWTHGDFVMIHPETRQIFFLGRADGVLNPSGIRFGSAEVYSVIESHFPSIQDSLCVGQRRANDHDETVLLFLQMAPGHKFTDQLIKKVQAAIARELSKRHVPRKVYETKAIPQTINGKKVELPVKQIVSGFKIKPSSTLANPESLDYYYQFAAEEEKAKL